jgi:DNA end-binding protein Ku
MPRAIWTGTLSFGLVSIPVRLFNATAPQDVRFHQFQAGTGQRVRIRRVVSDEQAAEEPSMEWAGSTGPAATPEQDRSTAEGEEPDVGPVPDAPGGEREVDYRDLVKGYEVDPGRYVLVDPDELAGLAPEQTRTIDIEDFVDLVDIDPVFFEKSYFVVPQRGGEQPYALLVRAMEEAGKVAIGRFVMRSREHLAAVRPMRGVLALETLFYADEVRTAEDVGASTLDREVSVRELKLARQLIDFLATDWKPERYRDTYRDRVLELIESKARGEEMVVEQARSAPVVPDLMAALRASVDAAKDRRSGEEDRPAKRRRSATQ